MANCAGLKGHLHGKYEKYLLVSSGRPFPESAASAHLGLGIRNRLRACRDAIGLFVPPHRAKSGRIAREEAGQVRMLGPVGLFLHPDGTLEVGLRVLVTTLGSAQESEGMKRADLASLRSLGQVQGPLKESFSFIEASLITTDPRPQAESADGDLHVGALALENFESTSHQGLSFRDSPLGHIEVSRTATSRPSADGWDRDAVRWRPAPRGEGLSPLRYGPRRDNYEPGSRP